MDYESMSMKDLKALAKELGVLPSGRPKKSDIIKALQPGGPAPAPKEQPATSQQLYEFDHTYVVLKPFSGYEPGDRVSNFARTKGLMLVKEGMMKLDKDAPPASNPNAVAKKAPQSA